MTDVVVVKFGGGLITNKAKLCTPDLAIIEQLVAVVKRCLESGLQVIVVHGAGSFGHLRAKYWRLNEGLLPGWNSLSKMIAHRRKKRSVLFVRTCLH